MMHADFLIVGQGIAGTLLAWHLKKRGKHVRIMDAGHSGSSSMVAAGIVNPITGKNFVCSWRSDEFLPEALRIYQEISDEIGKPALTMSNIIRTIDSIQDENNWIARTADPRVSEYMMPYADVSSFKGFVKPAFSYGELTGTFHVHMSRILKLYNHLWKTEGCLIEDTFRHDQLVVGPDYLYYNEWSFKNIVFCEGCQAANNPFFPAYPMAPSKGEAFIIQIPEAQFTKMYKDQIFIVHQYKDVYWAGGGYEWKMQDDKPSEQGFQRLKALLDSVLTVPYHILDHKAAIRPTMHQRRPLIMSHPDHRGMYIFNGLGTKGGSMAPLISLRMAEALESGFSGLLSF